MSRIRILIISVIAVVVIGVGAFLYITRPVAAPSEDVQANTEQLTAEDLVDNAAVFRISQESSQVEFNIDEILNGSDFTAVGVTNEVAGDILVNFDDPTASEVGEIRVNARTLETDNSRRDGAISRLILQSESNEFEFIDFQPTSITGLPEEVNVGDTLTFQITGDLTITGTSNEVTFDTSVTLTSEDQITGTAEATVMRSDYNLTIPSVPSVAGVDEDVLLKIAFVADRVVE